MIYADCVVSRLCRKVRGKDFKSKCSEPYSNFMGEIILHFLWPTTRKGRLGEDDDKDDMKEIT